MNKSKTEIGNAYIFRQKKERSPQKCDPQKEHYPSPQKARFLREGPRLFI